MSKCIPCKNQRKINTLENWVAVDRILFNESHPKNKLKKKSLKKYNKMKSALLYNLHELYSNFDFISENNYTDFRELNKKVIHKADHVMNESIEHLKQKHVKPLLESAAKKSKDEEKFLLHSLYKTAIDKFVLEKLLLDVNPKHFKDGKPKICLEIHKSLRDDLIDLVLDKSKV